MRTNIQRRVGQVGGMDESADAAAPFTLRKGDPRPPGMVDGVYWLNSGRYGYYSPTINQGLRGGPRATKRFEIVYQHTTPDGRIVTQQGGYADPESSWGWDGRLALQPRKDGTDELIVTQGAMELPSKLIGALPNAPDLPRIVQHNYSRSRHAFKPLKFEDGKSYVLDLGSILNSKPDTSGNWITFETVSNEHGTVNIWQSAHGYGENFIPDPDRPERMWVDPDGYTYRIFDLVTREVHARAPDGSLRRFPATTRSVAFRMDPNNPSKVVPRGTKLPNGEPADHGILIMSEEIPGVPGKVVKSSLRMGDMGENIIEERILNLDGTVTVRTNVDEVAPLTLVEGFNPVAGVVPFPSGKRYFLGTCSASEYTAGARSPDGTKKYKYGAYIGFRPESKGPIGRYTPVTVKTELGLDFADALEDFTELYGLSWGAGRPQAYKDEFGEWWMDIHAVDIDILPEGSPVSGYPETHEEFRDNFRRHKNSLPIEWSEKNGMPWFEIVDPEIAEDLKIYRALKKAKLSRAT